MDALLPQAIRAGRLTVIMADGQRQCFEGPDEGPCAVIRVTDPKLVRRMIVIPDLYLGEGYVDGRITVEEGSLYDVIDFCALNLMPRLHDPNVVIQPTAYHSNAVGKAQTNVAFHYDLNRALFALFLDRDLQYSCAYFTAMNQSLEEAQLNKKKHIAASCCSSPACASSTSVRASAAWRPSLPSSLA
jgi:cyclopropane-fatty-acyl-phospholipid synthase